MISDTKPSVLTRTLFLVLVPLATLAQTMGTAKVPADLLKATLLIETAETKTNTVYVPSGLSLITTQGGRPISLTPTNLVVQVQQPQTIFHGVGSGVLLTKSNVNLFVTAKHVVQSNEGVFFRIPQKSGTAADHHPFMSMKQSTGIGWIYSTNADVALTVLVIDPAIDDVSFIPLDIAAEPYSSISVGDEILVSGLPSSVIELDGPALRSGIVSSKLEDQMILISVLTLPGDSGGPVFWKPTVGLNIFGNQLGEGRVAGLIGLVLYSPVSIEPAVSPISGRARIFFEGNSGLTMIVSTSRILELLDYPVTKAAMARALENK